MYTTIIINERAFEAECCQGMDREEAWGCHKTYDAFLAELRRAAVHAGFKFETDAGREGSVSYRIIEGHTCPLRAGDALELMKVQVAEMRSSKIS